MSPCDNSDPIDDCEILYRRIAKNNNWYTPESRIPLSPNAFMPQYFDPDGISLDRARFLANPEDAAAHGREGKQYYIVELNVGAIRRLGLSVCWRPESDNCAHCQIPELNYPRKLSDRDSVTRIAAELAKLCKCSVSGPYFGLKSVPVANTHLVDDA